MPDTLVPSFVRYQAWLGTRALHEPYATLTSRPAWRVLWSLLCSDGQELASLSMPGSVCTPRLQGLPWVPPGHSSGSSCTGG